MKSFTNRRLLGTICIVLSIAIALFFSYQYSAQRQHSISFSTSTMLASLWESYNKFYLDPESHRTIDPSRDSVTTSEGESYTMLRAVWQGDKEIFDQQWEWTKTNLQHSEDDLFAWLWGEKSDGTYGVLTEQNGQNTASDGDSDIALSLIFAYSRWQDPTYLVDARSILIDMWEKEVIIIDGKPYLAANDVEKTSTSGYALVNPSYLSPYAYKIFAKVDPTHPWNDLADSSYTLLEKSMAAELDTGTSANLPPDWILIDKTDGTIHTATTSSSLTTNFGYDALRTPWRLALDWEWTRDERAKALLDKMSFLSDTYNQTGKLAASYTHAGKAITDSDGVELYNYESASMYGATIGYFMVSDPELGERVYTDKLQFLFDANSNDWKQRLPYYEDNWAWFGLALYNHALPDLSATLPNAAFTADLSPE